MFASESSSAGRLRLQVGHFASIGPRGALHQPSTYSVWKVCPQGSERTRSPTARADESPSP